jgi:hypothetical protein
MHAPGASRSFSSHAGNFAHAGQRPGANFTQRNFGAGSRSGVNALQRSSGSFAHGNLGGRTNTNFVQQHFGASTHLGGQSSQRQSNFVNRNFANNNLARGANLASFSGSRAGNNVAAGHLHQSLFNGGNLHHNVTSNFARNANVNTNVNRNFNAFNSRWSGGWNRWGNRSFFFGLGTPFGGYYRGYYPWYGYGFNRGFGFGLGFYPYYYGYGYGYPYYYGYPGYSYASYLNCYPYYNNYGNNYGTYGYGDYGYGGSAYPATYGSYAYPSGTTTYNSYAATTSPYGADYSNYASVPQPAPGNVIGATAPGPSSLADDSGPQPSSPQAAPRDNPPGSVDDITAADFAGQGEIDFKAGKYEVAGRNFRHALVDDPSNAGALMLLGQALFATAQYDEAAGATATAMQSLPPDKWGAVLENYRQLYGRPEDYASQLRALEKARDAKPESPALHFLLGFHYGFSGHRSQAIAELDTTIKLEPKDQMAKALSDQLTGKLKGPAGQNSTAPFRAPNQPAGPLQSPDAGLR